MILYDLADKEKERSPMNVDFYGSINVFTDASFIKINDTGVACSGYALVCNDQVIDTGYNITSYCTNNYGELYALFMGIYAGVEFAYKTGYAYRINIFSDSQISVNGLRDWIFKWYKKTDTNHVMKSSGGMPIPDGLVYKQIVKLVVYYRLPIHIYHQLGHMKNVRESQDKVLEYFKKVNLETIDRELAARMIYYNFYVDRLVRNNLLSITGNRKFDVDKYKKEEEDDAESLTEEEMTAYGMLINRVTSDHRQVGGTETPLREKTNSRKKPEGKDVTDTKSAAPAHPVPREVVAADAKPEPEPVAFPPQPEEDTVSLAIGDRIHHRRFGKGIVTAVQNGKQFEAEFETAGAKSLIWGVFEMGIVQKSD